MYSNKSNSSNAVHPSPPLGRDQTTLLSRRPHEEPIQRIARGEHCKMSHYNLLPPRVPDPKIPIQYQLQFMNKVKNTTFTTDLVKDENGRPIKVAIYDTYTKPESVISPDNILSSAKVKLILLDAELCTVNWSPSEFVQNVLTERERKGPILTGRSLIIQLENGVGTFKNIVINDNSSWRKCGFRLAVMVECDREEGYLNGERVQEAVSESFWVKDRRGKAFQKPDRLKLAHSVRYIKKIGKDRASLLQKEKIETVEDFLKRLKNNESDLRKILCIKSESNKEWESMVEHVMQCADEYHAKCTASNNSSQPQQALVDPMKRKMSHGTNGYHLVVDLGSSEPNPSENNIIEGLPQPELSFNPLLPSHSSWGGHATLAPKKSFLCVAMGVAIIVVVAVAIIVAVADLLNLNYHSTRSFPIIGSGGHMLHQIPITISHFYVLVVVKVAILVAVAVAVAIMVEVVMGVAIMVEVANSFNLDYHSTRSFPLICHGGYMLHQVPITISHFYVPVAMKVTILVAVAVVVAIIVAVAMAEAIMVEVDVTVAVAIMVVVVMVQLITTIDNGNAGRFGKELTVRNVA